MAKLLQLEPRDVGRLVELCHQARLVAPEPSALVATDLAATWWGLSRSRRWLVLVRAWLGSSGFVSRALSADEDGNPRPALGDSEPVAAAAAARAVTLDVVAAVPDGEAFDPEQLAETVVWRSPNLWGTGFPPPEELVAWTLEEADLLGLVAGHAPVPVLRALVAGDEAAVESLAAASLGVDQDRFVLQGDLTALALGPLEPAVAGSLGEVADRHWGRSVPTYRFTEASVRRALDRGWTADGIGRFLADHALSGVPQPLEYLLSDVERRYGAVRVLTASAVIITDDEALAVEIASTNRAARIGLRLVAPTVLVGPVEPHRLVEELRAEGWFPVLDGGVATVGRAGGGGRRGRADEVSTPSRAPAPDQPRPERPRPDPLPADWTGPALEAAVLPAEVADAVDQLVTDRTEAAATEIDHRLHLHWNRTTLVRHRRDGHLAEVRGVLVGVDETLTLLCDNGIEELPLDTVVAVEDPAR
ncbi:MAG: helicase-associated domain-containing protein [Acidimicrobiales bacterium]